MPAASISRPSTTPVVSCRAASISSSVSSMVSYLFFSSVLVFILFSSKVEKFYLNHTANSEGKACKLTRHTHTERLPGPLQHRLSASWTASVAAYNSKRNHPLRCVRYSVQLVTRVISLNLNSATRIQPTIQFYFFLY